MANNVDSRRRSRAMLGLVTFVLLLGTLLAWWGTRDHRQLFGESSRQPVTAASVVVREVTPEGSASLDRGYEISQRQCAGCHEITTRSSGPSYQEIVNFYRRGLASSDGNSDLRSRLAAAVIHPRPGWGNFAPGPAEPGLSVDDRTAVASWIMNNFYRTQHADKDAGQ